MRIQPRRVPEENQRTNFSSVQAFNGAQRRARISTWCHCLAPRTIHRSLNLSLYSGSSSARAQMKADALRLQSLRVPGNLTFNYRSALQEEDLEAPPTSLNAFNDEHVRLGGGVTEFARLTILFAVQPLFRAFHRWKFEDNDPFWFPIAFENFGFAATNDVFAAVLVN